MTDPHHPDLMRPDSAPDPDATPVYENPLAGWKPLDPRLEPADVRLNRALWCLLDPAIIDNSPVVDLEQLHTLLRIEQLLTRPAEALDPGLIAEELSISLARIEGILARLADTVDRIATVTDLPGTRTPKGDHR